jgi:hypothetical protein
LTAQFCPERVELFFLISRTKKILSFAFEFSLFVFGFGFGPGVS